MNQISIGSFDIMHSYPVNINLPAETICSVTVATKVRKELRYGECLLIVTINFFNVKAFDAGFSHRKYWINVLRYLCETKLSVPLANSKEY